MKKNEYGYRDKGAIGALLDIYEDAIQILKETIADINDNDLCAIVDYKTSDNDCRSIQTILSHVVRAGYSYIVAIRKSLGEQIDYHDNILLPSAKEYTKSLDKMFSANLKLFKDYPSMRIETYVNEEKVMTRWGQTYDVDQLLEHAIVHILRHNRQIQRFIIKINKE